MIICLIMWKNWLWGVSQLAPYQKESHWTADVKADTLIDSKTHYRRLDELGNVSWLLRCCCCDLYFLRKVIWAAASPAGCWAAAELSDSHVPAPSQSPRFDLMQRTLSPDMSHPIIFRSLFNSRLFSLKSESDTPPSVRECLTAHGDTAAHITAYVLLLVA